MNASAKMRHVVRSGRSRARALGCAAMLLALPAGAWATDQGLAVGAEGIVAASEARAVLEVTNVRVEGERITATLVNSSSSLVKDIQLVIRHAFLWNDERNPGTDNPGRTEYYLVLGEVEPNGTLAFEYRPDPPLPNRDDGTFKTSIEVAGFTEVGAD